MHIKCMLYVLFVWSTYTLTAAQPMQSQPSDLLFIPFNPTPMGIQAFFTNVFNAPLYAKEVLPNSSLHLEQLLGLGRKEQLPIEYTTSILWLFHTKALDARYINADALEQCITTIAPLLEYHIQQSSQQDIPKEVTRTAILESFATHADLIVTNPNDFFDTMATHIVERLGTWLEHEREINTLRSNLMMLIHTMTTKIMWDITDQLLWHHIKRLADRMATLEKISLLTKQQLNTLYWTIITRLCYMIDLQAAAIPLEVYQEMLEEITANSHPLLSLPDLEPNITSKGERLRQAVIDNGGLARAQAREYGIIA